MSLKNVKFKGKNNRLEIYFGKDAISIAFSRPRGKEEYPLEAKNIRTELEMTAGENSKHRIVHESSSLSKDEAENLLNAMMYFGFYNKHITLDRFKEWAEKVHKEATEARQQDFYF